MNTKERMPQERLIDLLAGYWRAQVVQVFASLGIADRLAHGALSAGALAQELKVSVDGLTRLLRAAAALDLLRVDEEQRYALTALGGTLRSGRLGSLRDYAMTIAGPTHWQSWARLEDAVRSGKPSVHAAVGSDLWTHLERHAEEGARFSRAMGDLSQLVAVDLAAQYDFSGCRQIVDIGGAQGTLLAAALLRAPQARGVLYDRESVIAAAQQAPALRGALRARVDFIAGDFFRDALPAGGDCYLLKQILHDYEDADCAALLARLRASIAPGGRLVILEMPLDGDAEAASLVDLDMLVLLGGRERSTAQYRALTEAAGFSWTRSLPLRGGFVLMEVRAS